VITYTCVNYTDMNWIWYSTTGAYYSRQYFGLGTIKHTLWHRKRPKSLIRAKKIYQNHRDIITDALWQNHQMRGTKNHEMSQVWTMHYVWSCKAYSVINSVCSRWSLCNSRFPLPPSFCKFWLRNRCYKCISFDVSICRNLRMQVPFRSGTAAQHTAFRCHIWLRI